MPDNMEQTDMIRYVSGPYNLNTYVLVCKTTLEAVIIDPGGPESALAELIRKHALVPKAILNTHGHADQFFRMDTFKKTCPIPYCLHAADDRFFRDPDVQKKTFSAVGLPPPYPADHLLRDQRHIRFGRTSVTILHTPGHTPGSVCFLCEDNLFTGDALFVGEAGRTDLPGGDLDQLIASIRTKIMPLDRRTIIHPGHHHGQEYESTLEREMKENIYITDFILDA